jgi:hypothetical protein
VAMTFSPFPQRDERAADGFILYQVLCPRRKGREVTICPLSLRMVRFAGALVAAPLRSA